MENIKRAERSQAERLIAAVGIDTAASTPLYVQVRNGLTRLIKQKYFGTDVALPSERTLAEMLGISRVTARKALDALVSNGLIVRRHGSGNYIAPLIEQTSTRLVSFTEELKSRGYAPGTHWINRDVEVAKPEEAVALNLSSGQFVARLERLRLADDMPVAINAAHCQSASFQTLMRSLNHFMFF